MKLAIIVTLLTFCIFNNAVTEAHELQPFTSDGCSAFPEGTLKQKELWLRCCTIHDFAYWQGGTYQERTNADIALKECVAAVGQKEIAVLMLAGVRVGGSPFFPTSFRWGYGWPYPKFYGELTKEEQAQIKQQLDSSEYKTLLDSE